MRCNSLSAYLMRLYTVQYAVLHAPHQFLAHFCLIQELFKISIFISEFLGSIKIFYQCITSSGNLIVSSSYGGADVRVHRMVEIRGHGALFS